MDDSPCMKGNSLPDSMKSRLIFYYHPSKEEIKEIECHDESAKKAPEKSELSQYFQEFDDKGCQPSNCSAIMDEPALTREPKKIKINELFDFDEAMEFSGQSESFHSKLMLNTTEKSILSIDNLFDL